jgi:hypothetical protein
MRRHDGPSVAHAMNARRTSVEELAVAAPRMRRNLACGDDAHEWG